MRFSTAEQNRYDMKRARSSAFAIRERVSPRLAQAVADHVEGCPWTAREVGLALREAMKSGAPLPYLLIARTRDLFQRPRTWADMPEAFVALADIAKKIFEGGVIELPRPRFPENHRPEPRHA